MTFRYLRRLTGLALCLSPLVANADVFINEIHYDDVDADNNESVEVVATAGETLSAYRIVRYNGSGGASYGDDLLPAGSSVSCGATVSVATLIYPLNGLQNGAPDGLALVGPGDVVVQFLSYEGTFTAIGGPANGMLSTSIGVEEGFATPDGFSLQLSGTGNAYANFSWQQPAAASFDGCNTSQTFTGGTDAQPSLASSLPVNNAPAFPANANLQLTFSEAVDLGASWVQVACSTSGTRGVADFTISGGPSAYGLDPSLDFTQSETCTLTLNAAQITDRGGMAQALAGNSTIAFTVGAPTVNDPPVLLATTPMQGDNNFPAAGNLVALFSEAVTTQTGAFALACAQSGNINVSFPASGTSFSIDTATALIGGESCTFTVRADRISDLEGAPLVMGRVVTFTVRTGGVGTYYDQVNTSSPAQLRCTLHQTIRAHTEYPYGWDQLEIADEDPLNSNRILDIYRNCSYAKGAGGDRVGGSGAGATCGPTSGVHYNREHVWPRSLGFNNTALAAHNDLHMLHLSDELFNAHRGNKPFATCTQASGCIEDRTIAYNGQGGGNGSYPGLSNWYTSNDGNLGSYEVWSRLRGNMARAIFYMAIRYEGGDNLPDLELTDDRSLIVITPSSAQRAYMGLLATLLQWHLQDPATDPRELDRNEVVFNFQGNRNPFIDHPEWATLALFQSVNPTTCNLGAPPLIFANGFE